MLLGQLPAICGLIDERTIPDQSSALYVGSRISMPNLNPFEGDKEINFLPTT